jgi:hypothetical protein
VAWQRALETPRRRTLALWSALSILALLTHYFAAFLFVGELLVLVRRVGWQRLAAPVGAYAIAVAALAPLAIAQATSGQTDWIATLSLPARVEQTAKDFLVGLYGPWGIVLAPTMALLVAVLLVRLSRQHDPQHRQPVVDVVIVAVVAIGLPVLLAVTQIENVFDARNVVGVWPALAVLAAAGLAASRRPRVGAWVGAGLIAVSAAVIAGTLALPAYQRDDWRDAAHSLPAPAPGSRVLVSERYGATPLSVYMPDVRQISKAGPVSTRELDFVFLRRAHGGPWGPSGDSLFAPIAPSSPAIYPLAPFRLVTVRRTAAYATYRFLAPLATSVTVGWLRRAFGDRNADVAAQG